MRNAVVLIAYGNLELTQRAVASVLAQDIPIDLYIVDNGSKDETWDWLEKMRGPQGNHEITAYRFEENRSPIRVGNWIMQQLFVLKEYDYILGIPNDVVLPENLYRLMLEWPRGIVTASMTQDPHFPRFETAVAVAEFTPFCVALIRKWAWEAIVTLSGFFWDESYTHYASDCDLAMRMGACGIRGIQLDVQYYHEISATLKRSIPEEKQRMCREADKDRETFKRKWGVEVSDPYFGQMVSDLSNKGIPRG